MVNALLPTNGVAALSEPEPEVDALVSLLTEFESEADHRKLEFLKHRYAGFRRKEAAVLVGVTIQTANKWLKEDERVARFDDIVSTGKRQSMRKQVLNEEWFRNFWLVLKRDEYILKKVHGLLEVPYQEVTADGKRTTKYGSPIMLKEDWDYYAQMRKMYTPDAWVQIEKVISGDSGGTFNITELILNMPTNQQINVKGA